MCLCSLRYPKCKGHAPYILSSVSRPALPYLFYIISYKTRFPGGGGGAGGGKVVEHKMCFDILYHFHLKHFSSAAEFIEKFSLMYVYWFSGIVPVTL
jgi:hypothetical protein